MTAAKKAARKAAYIPAMKPKTRLKNPGSLSGDGMTPLLPPEGKITLEDRAFDLTREAGAFAGQVHPDNHTTNPDDWAKISGRKGERIVFIRTLVHESNGTKKHEGGRSIEPTATGQYL